jgi:hypothetical protein
MKNEGAKEKCDNKLGAERSLAKGHQISKGQGLC